MNETDTQPSPHWSSTTKLIAGLTIVAVLAFMFIRFQNILGPLLMAFILSYLFYPVADALRRWFKLPWRLAVTVIYLVVVVILLSLLTVSGFALFTQIQSLIKFYPTGVGFTARFSAKSGSAALCDRPVSI